MVMIILTGNYNFFNWLTIALCFSLLDDDHLQLSSGKLESAKTGAFCDTSWQNTFPYKSLVTSVRYVGLSVLYLVCNITAAGWSLMSRLNVTILSKYCVS